MEKLFKKYYIVTASVFMALIRILFFLKKNSIFVFRILHRPLNKNDFVCSRHFEEEDYIPDEENLDSRGRQRSKRRLKPDAFPKLHLDSK